MVPVVMMSAFIVGSWCIMLHNRVVFRLHSLSDLTLWHLKFENGVWFRSPITCGDSLILYTVNGEE